MARTVAFRQGWNTQWSQLAVGFPDIDTLDWLRIIRPLQQVLLQLIQMISQTNLHLVLVYPINTRCASST